MKAGCYLSLALLTGLILANQAWLKIYVDPPEVWIAASVLGLFSWFALGALWNAWSLTGLIRALANARDGLLPADRQLAAMEGRLRPYGDPIIAPFSDDPCVVYEYEISRRIRENKQTRDIVDFAGIGMAPCEVVTDDHAVALLGYPDLDGFDFRPAGLGERARARKYVASTEWEDASGLRAITGFSSMMQALTSAGESIRRDFRMISPANCSWLPQPGEEADETAGRSAESDSYAPLVKEKRLSPGQPVVAIGVYVAEVPALTTRPGTTFQRVQLRKGTIAAVLQQTQQSFRAYLIGGLISPLIIYALAMGILWVYRHSDATQKRWKEELRQAVTTPDEARIRQLLTRGLDINAALDGEEKPALQIADSVEMVRLLLSLGADPNRTNKYGDTALMLAARANKLDLVQTLIEGRADINAIRPMDHSTALVQATSAGLGEMCELLRSSGAVDEAVTATDGTPVDESHPAWKVCTDYVQAVHEMDLARMNTLTSSLRSRWTSAPDWDALCNTRPLTPRLQEGFLSGGRATVRFSGQTPAGFDATWVLQLVVEAGEWRVLRERWVTNGI